MWISNSDIAGIFYVFANTDLSKVKIYTLELIIIYLYNHYKYVIYKGRYVLQCANYLNYYSITYLPMQLLF